MLSWAILGLVAAVAVLGCIAWYLRVIFAPMILAGAIVFVLNPVVTRLQQRHVPRAAGAAIAYLAVAAAVTAIGLVVVPLATDQARELRRDWPQIQEKAERWIDERAEQSQGTFFEFTRADIGEQLSADDRPIGEQLDRLGQIGLQIFHALLILVLAPVIAFYLLVDVPHIRKVTEELIPEGARAEAFVVGHRLNRAIGGYFRGQLFVALIVGILCSIGLGVIGLRFWFLVGMVAGLFNVIPLVGPWIGGIPGVVIALTTGSPVQALGVVVVMALAQQVDNHFITPQVMQRAVRLHPAMVMLALLAGGSLFGFFGLLLAVPTAAVLKILVAHVWRIHVLGEALEEVVVDQVIADADPDGVPA